MAAIAVHNNAISWNIVDKNAGLTAEGREYLVQRITSLAKHLTHFPPETQHLQVVLEKLVTTSTYRVELSLRLPANIMHAEKADDDLLKAFDSATNALELELSGIRFDAGWGRRWKHSTWHARRNEEEKVLVFSEPLPPGTGPQTGSEMVAELLATQDKHLFAHARRLVRMAELTGELPTGAVEARDIVDEAARICLAYPEWKPVELTYEQWLYRLIREEFDRQSREFLKEHPNYEATAGAPAIPLADEAEGYDAEKPLDLITAVLEPEEDLVEEHYADPSVVPPDAAISGRELVELLQKEIRYWPADEREVFELYFLVGFDRAEISAICRKPIDAVDELIEKAQAHLRSFLITVSRSTAK